MPDFLSVAPPALSAGGATRNRVVTFEFDLPTDAERWGMAHRVVPAAALDATVDEWATRLAAKPATAMSMTTSQLRAYGTTFREADLTELDGDLLAGGSASAEFRATFTR